MRSKWSILLFAAAIGCGGLALASETVDYAQDIKPILKARCYACHGALKQESGLRLDTGVSIRRGGDSGPAVEPGQPDASLLIKRVSAADEFERMPPEGEPLSRAQLELLRVWINSGASSPAGESPETDLREHWAFRPPRRSELPAADSSGHAIDAFIDRRLRQRGLQPQPVAAKHHLLRRVYVDLIGMPPTRDELRVFLSDDSASAYERVVDRLLQDPRHGERWARHWMDVWRYSDWYGRRNVPDVWNSAPQVWRWRDWIVQSLNADKGYDRMVREMLAGDEIRPEDPQTALATGYLVRNWYALNPNDWMRNTVEHTGKAFLGLTFNCAHCHDHKYDPITQDEYFQLRAFFEPMYVRQDRVPGEADPGPFQDYEYSTLRKIQHLGAVRVFDKSPDSPTWFYTGGDERNRVEARGSVRPGVPPFLGLELPPIEPVDLPLQAWYPGIDPAIQATALGEAHQEITDADAELAAAAAEAQAGGDARCGELRREAAEAHRAAAVAGLASVEARIAADAVRFRQPAGADAASLGRTAARLEQQAAQLQLEADVLSREYEVTAAEAKGQGDDQRGKEIEGLKKQLAAAEAALAKARKNDAAPEAYTPLSPEYPRTSTGRRRALAEWITSHDHPLTARVAVNHIWMRHFQAPLVETVSDFGRNGAPPTHPDVLDWLAVELMESGWSMKHLHRLIVTSAAYRRSSAAAVSDSQLDPENKLLWRMNTGRIESEVIRDSFLHCAGLLDTKIGGRPLENNQALTSYRRSLYYEFYPEDGGANALSDLFDPPNPLECYRRTRSIVPQQALVLTNSDLVHRIGREIVADWQLSCAGGTDQQLVTHAFERILSRAPRAAEHAACLQAISKQRKIARGEGHSDPATVARESLVRALLNHNDFVTIR